MNNSQVRDISEAVLASMTEEEFAKWRCKQGAHLICHRGRYWEEVYPGFYQPIHWMARLSAEQATRPAPLCWGFRAALCEDDVAVANGAVPVHVLSDLEAYNLQNFSSNRRHNIRRCRKRVRIIELLSPTLLQEQGYEVVLSATTRIGTKVPLKEDYLASLIDYIVPGRRLILAGLVGDKLGGYITGYAVNGTAYFESLHIATEALTTNINSGLVFDFVQVCCSSGNIHEVVNGQHRREDPALCIFKESIGFAIKHIPSRVWMNSIIGTFMRWQEPHKYYRLTGHD